VRFVQVYSGGNEGPKAWDAHDDLKKNHDLHCAETDGPIAALLDDLYQRPGLSPTNRFSLRRNLISPPQILQRLWQGLPHRRTVDMYRIPRKDELIVILFSLQHLRHVLVG